MPDPLSDALRALRLRGTAYFQAVLSAPWGMDVRAGAFAHFHLVTAGECYVQLAGAEPVCIAAGELALLPYGHAHALSHAPGGRLEPAERLLPTLCSTGRLGRGEPTTGLVCGHFELDRDSQHPLLTGLPELLHVSGRGEAQELWVSTATQLAAIEAQRQDPGAAAIVDRLAEALLIQVLRRWAEQAEHPPGFLAAVAEPGLGRALGALHKNPEIAWTIASLAQHAGMSRTIFAARFKARVGMAVGSYLTRWRLLKARQWLEETTESLDTIAERVGYADALSFARAFERSYGTGPGSWRRERTAS